MATARWSTASLGAVVCALIVGILYPRRSLSADEACALLNNATAVELIARRSVAPRVLTPAECAAIVDEAEGRGFAPKRHKLYSTTDVEITSYDRDWQRAGAAATSRLPVAHALLASAVWPRARGALGALFGVAEREIELFEAFVVRYDAAGGEQAGLELHRDGGELSFILSLNAGFEGGGTVFGRGASAAAVAPGAGDLLVFSGQHEHGGAAVTRGRRYVLTGFAYVRCGRNLEVFEPKMAEAALRRELAAHDAASPEAARARAALDELGLRREVEKRARALAAREAALGPDHRDVAQALDALASAQERAGRAADARASRRRALAIREAALGPEHWLVAQTLDALGANEHAAGLADDALARHERALAIRKRALGLGHVDVARSLERVAAIHLEAAGGGRLEEALKLARRALQIREAQLAPDHPDVAASLGQVAAVRAATGAVDEARAGFERALAIREAALGPDHRLVAETRGQLESLRGGAGGGG